MSVLVLKLSGPLQSWGTSLKLRDHETDMMPSKSAVIGMIAAAFGRRRNADISDLSSLRFGARSDDPGTLLRDYHTAHPWRFNKNNELIEEDPYVGNRYYLQDACFCVGLEGEREFLELCAEALNNPIFPPYLGRRSCVPDPGLVVGVFDGTLEENFKKLKPFKEAENKHMRICVEVQSGGDRMRHDAPISFDYHNRKYAYRIEKELVAED